MAGEGTPARAQETAGRSSEAVRLCLGDILLMEIHHPQNELFAAVENVSVGHAAIVTNTSPPKIAHSTGKGVKSQELCTYLSRIEYPVGNVWVMRPWPEAAFRSASSACFEPGQRAAEHAESRVVCDRDMPYPDVDLTPYLLRTVLAGLVVNNRVRRRWVSSVLRHVAETYRTREGVTVFCTEFVYESWTRAGVTFELPATDPSPRWSSITTAGVDSLLDDVDKHEFELLKGRRFASARARVARRARRAFWWLIRIPDVRNTASRDVSAAVEWLATKRPEWYAWTPDRELGFVRLYDLFYSPSLAAVYVMSAVQLRRALQCPVGQ